MNRRRFLEATAVLFGTLLYGGAWLEARRHRQEKDARLRVNRDLLSSAKGEEAWAKLGQELLLPIRDAIHYERWARPFYGLPPFPPPPPAVWELCAERMQERYG